VDIAPKQAGENTRTLHLPGAVRFSIGLEDPEDLISDAYVALESLSRP
jgi:cystathionine beta-lyase/cystathionine gamma-synthase